MRVLLINQFFWPDSAATGQLLADVAQDLVKDGHTVDVICGGSYAQTSSNVDLDDVPSIVIHRIKGMRFSRGKLGRISSYATFYFGAFWRALRLRRPDVILTLTTPPLLSVAGALLKKLRGSRFCIWEMDVYPDVAVDLGYIRKGGTIDRCVGMLADWSRRRADKVIVLGECMQDRLAARGLAGEKMAVVHNWADGSQIRTIPRPKGQSPLQIVYSGNLGLAHDVGTIISGIRMLKDDNRFSFTFIGGGARRAEIAQFVDSEEIKSVEMRPYVARADLSESLGVGDIGLVTQRDDCCGSVVPSKVYGLLAAGKPILFIGPKAATPARLIEQYECGWHIPVGANESLVMLLQHLAQHPDEVTSAGHEARKALDNHFDRPLGTERIIDQLMGRPSQVGVPSISRASGVQITQSTAHVAQTSSLG